MLVLTALNVPPAPELPAGYRLRPVTPDDIPELGQLYFDAYEHGEGASTLTEARDDIVASFAGDYGPLWLGASPVVIIDGRIVAAALVVQRAGWPGAPAGPFVIEVFTDREHRRRGLARAVLSAAMRVAFAGGAARIGLQVDAANAGARRLYRSLGFQEAVPVLRTAGDREEPDDRT